MNKKQLNKMPKYYAIFSIIIIAILFIINNKAAVFWIWILYSILTLIVVDYYEMKLF